jgi:hypothetical protein
MIDLELDPSEIQRTIRELERTDLEAASIGELDACLTPLFRGYRTSAPRFEPGIYVYRGRKCQKPTNLCEIFYPPSHAVTTIGRANDIGESVFYGGTGKAVPLVELGVQPGDLVALSCWKTNGALILNHVGFSSAPDSFKGATRKLDEVYDFVRSTRKHGDLNALVHDYLAHTFARQVKDQHHYKLTIAISRELLSGSIIDGLLYPTIKMSGNADNIAFKKQSADRLLQFVSVEYILVKEVRDMQTDIDILDSATRVDPIGTLIWSGRGLQWQLRQQGDQLRVVNEFGQWVAYDTLGRRVNPE